MQVLGFKEFKETPLASASIGQIHRARLVNGEKVIVKVQQPDITKIIDVDLEIMLETSSYYTPRIRY